MTAILYGMSISAWTERARWALDHHGIAFEYREHVPMLGELALMMKTRKTKTSVPLLLDGETVVMGSPEIGRHAEQSGHGERLFPEGLDAEVDRWVGLAERALDVGRAHFMARLEKRPAVQVESLPAFIPSSLRAAAAPTAVMATRFLSRKHAVGSDIEARISSDLRPVLDELRAAVARSQYLLPSGFSFADITLASAMHIVRPREDSRCGPATRDAWTNEALLRDYGDLVEWRDFIYGKHRVSAPAS